MADRICSMDLSMPSIGTSIESLLLREKPREAPHKGDAIGMLSKFVGHILFGAMVALAPPVALIGIGYTAIRLFRRPYPMYTRVLVVLTLGVLTAVISLPNRLRFAGSLPDPCAAAEVHWITP